MGREERKAVGGVGLLVAEITAAEGPLAANPLRYQLIPGGAIESAVDRRCIALA